MSETSETLSGVYKLELVRYIYMYGGMCSKLLASERSERDTIRGVQIRAGAVRIYIYMYGSTYVILVAHVTYT